MDCEAYTIAKAHYLREVSVHRLSDNQTFSYQIYTPNLCFYDKNIAYQVKHIHGLPQVHTRRTNDFLLHNEALKILRDEFLARADVVAYKGGIIERDLLKRLGTKGINLEILGCDKYSNLITEYGISPVRCRYHNVGDYHCSRHEVQIFARFLRTIC
jgi:saccharopine dehydrogenase-like NADP-dependent oxidoreductase